MGCKMDLTNELRQSGWKHISEIVNEPNYNEDDVADIQLAYICINGPKKGKLEIIHKLFYSSYAPLYVHKNDIIPGIYFYRRLIPVLPNQVVIVERDDVDFMMAILFGATNQIQPNNHMIEKCNNLYDRLRAKLEGK